jgi:hypothetical protein
VANPTFPTSLPGPVIDTMAWDAQDNAVRSPTDSGVAKVRRRFTAVPEDFNCQIVVTAAQLQTLLDFHDLTLSTVLPFDWCDWRKPGDTTPVPYRFKKRPAHSAWGDEHYLATLELELLATFQGTFLTDIEGLTT